MRKLPEEPSLADRVAYLNPFIPMVVIWLIFIAYSITAPYLSEIGKAAFGGVGFYVGWLLYPSLIVFGSRAINAASKTRATVGVALIICVACTGLQPFVPVSWLPILRALTLVALLAVQIFSWCAVLEVSAASQKTGRTGLLKGVSALLFLPFFGVFHVHRVWRMCVRATD